MRTNIDMDDAVLAAAMQSGADKTKKAVAGADLAWWPARRPTARSCAGRASCIGTATTSAQHHLPARRRPPQAAAAMLVVDSGVWFDFFNGTPSPARSSLRPLLARGDTLLHADRDVDAFASLCGLRAWRH